MFSLVVLVLLFPLLGMLFNAFLGRRLRLPAAGIIATIAAGLAFAAACGLLAALLIEPEGSVVSVGRWLAVGPLDARWALRVDSLSTTMMLLVTGVGALIHLYAIGYMRGDPDYSRFFVYLNLFLFAMLLLVSADSFLTLFVGWELVGLCSYLLIGFWFDRGENGTANASAGRKAFVVNRIGDAGFIVAMALIFRTFGSLDFDAVFSQAGDLLAPGEPLVVAITLLLLLGAAGKSAQLPLFIWLPDAMAGPTPVSALIHAATMVTAGIYLMARAHVLFDLAPLTGTVAVWIGGLTALVGATAAAAQSDIKRVLAYSTISQLGFMVVAAGLGAYVAALFHLVSHAFFKGLLFLAAGSAIHGLEHGHGADRPAIDCQDMRLMGGLAGRMPRTFWTFLIGGLALAGLPPLAGFFSKDEILAAAWAGYRPVYLLLTLAAFVTAFYVARQVVLVFAGQPRCPAAAQAEESPAVMTAPLIALAGLAALGGLLNLPGRHSLGHWLAETVGEGAAPAFSPLVALISTAVALLGLALAYRLYRRQPAEPLARFAALYHFLQRGWAIDDLYRATVVRGFSAVSRRLARADDILFYGLDSLLGRTTGRAATFAQRSQTGQLNWNVAGIVLGFAGILLFLVLALN
jgi:NADH-quinone oxidoreductase subunit L